MTGPWVPSWEAAGCSEKSLTASLLVGEGNSSLQWGSSVRQGRKGRRAPHPHPPHKAPGSRYTAWEWVGELACAWVAVVPPFPSTHLPVQMGMTGTPSFGLIPWLG